MAIAVVVFVGVLAIIVGAYWALIVLPEGQEGRAVRARLNRPTEAIAAKLVKARDGLSVIDRILSRTGGASSPLTGLVARSGIRVTTGAVVLACIFFAIVLGSVALFLRAPLLVALVVAVIGGAAPILYLRYAAAKRLALFEEQFPEAIDLIARALRAGHALPTALQLVGDEIQEPIGGEFRQLFEQQNFGMSLPDALRAFAARIPLVDARFFVTALLTQREMGGNLAEVLDKLASVIRDRFKVKRQVRAVSAHGRITGWVLGFLPPVTAGVIFLISPQHLRLLTDDPLGVDMVVAAVVLQVIGIFAIRKIVQVEY